MHACTRLLREREGQTQRQAKTETETRRGRTVGENEVRYRGIKDIGKQTDMEICRRPFAPLKPLLA